MMIKAWYKKFIGFWKSWCRSVHKMDTSQTKFPNIELYFLTLYSINIIFTSILVHTFINSTDSFKTYKFHLISTFSIFYHLNELPHTYNCYKFKNNM